MPFSSTTKEYQAIPRGFTLVETLVAVSILLVVIIGPMTIAQKGMQNSYFAGEQTTAVYLAQEAIEHIQQLRDDTALAEYGNGANSGDTWNWYSALPVASCRNPGSNGGCDVDFINGGFRNCNTASSCLLRFDTSASPGTRIYGYGAGWSNSLYTRRIVVGAPIQIGGVDAGVPVTVTVSWSTELFSSGGTRTVTLQTYVYDHYSRFE